MGGGANEGRGSIGAGRATIASPPHPLLTCHYLLEEEMAEKVEEEVEVEEEEEDGL